MKLKPKTDRARQKRKTKILLHRAKRLHEKLCQLELDMAANGDEGQLAGSCAEFTLAVNKLEQAIWYMLNNDREAMQFAKDAERMRNP